ncbi:MAG: O-antigen ligase family protein [Niameybacter sp.]|nr:O-antigen ligase family protein [Niameybacter sp.]
MKINNVHSVNKQYKEKINSLCIAIFICINLLSLYLPANLVRDNIVVIISLTVFIIGVINNKNELITIHNMIIIVLIFILFLCSFLTLGINNFTISCMMFFIIYGVVGIYFSDKVIIIERIYEYIIFISIVCLPQIISQDIDLFRDNWMGISYSVLPSFIVCIVYLITTKKNIVLKAFSIMFVVIISYKIIPISSRGVILSLIMFILGLVIIKITKKITNKIYIFLLGAITVFFICFNVSEILKKMSDYLRSNDVDIEFLNKIMKLAERNDLLNGRDMFYYLSMKGIEDKPILGNGIGSFTINTGLNYPHNLMLEIAYEGGIILCFIVIGLLFYCMIKIFLDTKIPEEKRIFLWVIFCSCIFRLLFSYSYWMEQRFWLLIGLTLTFTISNKNKVRLY